MEKKCPIWTTAFYLGDQKSPEKILLCAYPLSRSQLNELSGCHATAILLFCHVFRVSSEDEGWWWRGIRLYQKMPMAARSCPVSTGGPVVRDGRANCLVEWYVSFAYRSCIISTPDLCQCKSFSPSVQPASSLPYPRLCWTPSECCYTAVILLLILFLHIILRSSGNPGRHPA